MSTKEFTEDERVELVEQWLAENPYFRERVYQCLRLVVRSWETDGLLLVSVPDLDAGTARVDADLLELAGAITVFHEQSVPANGQAP